MEFKKVKAEEKTKEKTKERERTKILMWKPSENVLEDMVKSEAKMRLSKEYMRKCDKVANEIDGWLRITDEMQRELVKFFAKKYGFNDILSIENALYYLKTAHIHYPKNKIFKEVPVYVRENKANKGSLKEGDNFINTPLFNNKKEPLQLVNLLDNKKPNIIFAGSHT